MDDTSFDDRPTFILVPGGFHVPAHFSRVSETLRAAGFNARAISLPSIEASSDPGDAMVKDAEAVMKAIHEVTISGKDIILVLHSYGGIPGCEAVALHHKQKNKVYPDRIRRLVMIAASVCNKGESLVPDAQRLQQYGIPVDRHEMMHVSDPVPRLFNDGTDDQKQWGTNWLAPQAFSAFTQKTSFEGWKDFGIPVTWISCARDASMSNAMAEARIEKLREAGVRLRCETIDSGHCPMVTAPDELAAILLGQVLEK